MYVYIYLLFHRSPGNCDFKMQKHFPSWGWKTEDFLDMRESHLSVGKFPKIGAGPLGFILINIFANCQKLKKLSIRCIWTCLHLSLSIFPRHLHDVNFLRKFEESLSNISGEQRINIVTIESTQCFKYVLHINFSVVISHRCRYIAIT